MYAYFENEKEKKTVNKDIENDLFTVFEKGFGRLLSAIEVDTIRFWIESGHSEEEIKTALYEALNSNVRNIKYIDKILLKWHQEKEQKQEGFSTVSEQWRGDINKTMEIANLNWVNKND